MTLFTRSLVIGCSMLALSACGPEEISSPGTGGDVIINPSPTPAPSPTPSPTPTPTGTYTAAADCPTISDPKGLTDGGVLTVPGGTVRVCSMPDRITASSTLVETADNAKVVYEIPTRVDVGTDQGNTTSNTDVTLTIEPGVVLFGGTGNSFLAVNRGNQINAVGTETKPIIFTSKQNVLGETSDDNDSQWGGVILLGRASISDCDTPGATGGTAACENDIEGTATPALYGGARDDDSSGTMRYFQIRYSGYAIAAGNELQSLTTGGTGTGTKIDYFQSFNSSDDGMEFFGGFVSGKHYVVVGASDDSIDTDYGVQLNLQYVIAIQRTNAGNGIIEADSSESPDNQPRQDSRIANATFVHQSTVSDAAAFRYRGGTDFALANAVLKAANTTCLDIDQPETFADAGTNENGKPFFASVYMQCGTAFTADGDEVDTAASFNATSNNAFSGGTNKSSTFTTTLSMNYINGTNESGAVAFDPTVFNRNGFTFDNAGYVGAVRDANDTWYKGWTCDSSIANFGSGKNCADSPFS